MRRLALAGALLLTGALAAPWPQRRTPRAETTTFTRDVAPILNAKCVTCHRPGEVAPMALLTYQDARPYARAIKEKVASRQMPPWFADKSAGTFANDPSLTDKEIATITRWVDAGAPQGDPSDMPTPPQFTDGWQLGEPDQIIELPEVQIPADGGDYFPTPNIALDLKEDRWIRAIEIRPSNRQVTHHSVIFSANVDMMAATGTFDVLGVWAVGTPATVYPEGSGRWIRKGQTLRTNLHYHPNGTPQTDRTRIGLYFGKGELKKEVVAALAGNVLFTIPANAPNHELHAVYVADQDINIVSFFPHMHLRGRDMTMTATFPGGRQETLLKVPAYDFNWQLFYYPKQRVALPRGTRLDLVAHYDNSAANQHNPDPTKPVRFGEASTAEMMFGMFEFTADAGVSPKPSTERSRIDGAAVVVSRRLGVPDRGAVREGADAVACFTCRGRATASLYWTTFGAHDRTGAGAAAEVGRQRVRVPDRAARGAAAPGSTPSPARSTPTARSRARCGGAATGSPPSYEFTGTVR